MTLGVRSFYTVAIGTPLVLLEACDPISLYCSESGFRCVEVESYSEDVLSLLVGRLSQNMEEACHPQLFFHNISPLIVTSKEH